MKRYHVFETKTVTVCDGFCVEAESPEAAIEAMILDPDAHELYSSEVVDVLGDCEYEARGVGE